MPVIIDELELVDTRPDRPNVSEDTATGESSPRPGVMETIRAATCRAARLRAD